MSSLTFYAADVSFRIQRKTDLKLFVPYIFKSENKSLLCLSIIVCSDDYLLRLNKQHLNHNFLTDILTFDLSVSHNTEAEIYISIDRIKENSRLLSLPLYSEFYRILFHGILHLCGYNDKTELQKRRMALKEDEYLNKFETFHVKQKK